VTRIVREPASAAEQEYDIAIIGGGIYGAMLLLIAAARGLRAILLERNDFGSETSFNSLRIIHGGLRYLQSLNLRRSRAMIAERAWFLRNFPDLVIHLPCLLPLYNRGLRRKSTMRIALGLDNFLSAFANDSLDGPRRIPVGRLVSPDQVRQFFPMVDPGGLIAGALWYDACVPNSQRLLVETLRWAISMGGRALNYVEAGDLLSAGNSVRGVLGLDGVTGEQIELRAKVILNATGPSSRSLAARYDQDIPDLFRPSLAWNVLFDREQISEYAIAISNADPGAHVYFLVPWKGKLLAGTSHGRVTSDNDKQVQKVQLDAMIEDINRAVPGLSLRLGEVARVFSGLLPVRRDGSVDLSARAVLHDHGKCGGPDGLFTVSGVKLVAAHQVAVKTIRTVCRRFFPSESPASGALQHRPVPDPNWDSSASGLCAAAAMAKHEPFLQKIIDEEAVIHLGDLALRRTTLWEEPAALLDIAPRIASLFPWGASEQEEEIAKLQAELQSGAAQM
jgi:glycerol-3-phosphate dehydrogenase